MFNFTSRKPAVDSESVLKAFQRSQAIIAFEPDGSIVEANANFLDLMGYTVGEILGKHHSLFMSPDEVASESYASFWEALGRGEYQSAVFCRWTKAKKPVWLQASYNPVFDRSGKVVRIVKIASDVTSEKNKSADAVGQLEAIGKVQAVIEFNLDGVVLAANNNFCRALGYDETEILGRHHRMFVDADYAATSEYRAFWERLRTGAHQAAEFKRLGKFGKEVWIQASYNPIFDANGKATKVVKYATDITGRKKAIDLTGRALSLLAQGDLRELVSEPFEGELDDIRTALNLTTRKFADILIGLSATSRSLRTATGEILSGSNDLAERTSRQAAAIEQTSAAMEQLSHTVVENSRRAQAAHTTSKQVAASGEKAGDVMHSAKDAMDRIANSSARISNIIGMIDDIAFQTNLLALNASVEAARAGDAGKGFAVVAVEVRRLAQSAASASAEVKALVENSTLEVSGGTKLVADASSRMLDVLQGIRDSSALVEEIARASNDQASAITEVTVAVREMDEMTQHNAALVEETNAAIEQTESQASELDAVVGIFSLPSVEMESAAAIRATKVPPKKKTAAVTNAPRAMAVGQDWSEF